MKNKDIKRICTVEDLWSLHFEGGKNPSIHTDGRGFVGKCSVAFFFFFVEGGSWGRVHYAVVSILQENLNYSPALNVVYQILPQTLPQLQSYRCLLTRGIDPFFIDFLLLLIFVGLPQEPMPTWTHRMGVSEGGVPPSEA